VYAQDLMYSGTKQLVIEANDQAISLWCNDNVSASLLKLLLLGKVTLSYFYLF